MTDEPFRLTRRHPHNDKISPRSGVWYVLQHGRYVGRVRLTDGGWNASVWRKVGAGREMTSLGGTWRTRRAAVIGLVGELDES